jgi:phosphate/sulfate permease
MPAPDILPVTSTDTNEPFTWPSVLPSLGEAAGVLDFNALWGAIGGELAYRLSPILTRSDALVSERDAVVGCTIMGLVVGTLMIGSYVVDNMGQQIQEFQAAQL